MKKRFEMEERKMKRTGTVVILFCMAVVIGTNASRSAAQPLFVENWDSYPTGLIASNPAALVNWSVNDINATTLLNTGRIYMIDEVAPGDHALKVLGDDNNTTGTVTFPTD